MIDATIGARALYDYVARSDKELSFSRGDFLQVMTKTQDNNWWDGYFGGRRGFIPVTYVEVTELKPSPSPATPQPLTPSGGQSSSLFVPAPPERKSSIPVGEGDGGGVPGKVSETPQECVIVEEPTSPEPREEQVTSPVAVVEPSSTLLASEETPPTEDKDVESESGNSQEDKMTDLPTTTRSRGGSSVKSLTKQFQDPSSEGVPKVLVEPHHSSGAHRRNLSDQKPSTGGECGEFPLPRSASGSGKVSMISSKFENKDAATAAPPPLKPKPAPLSSGAGDVFPLVQHGTNLGVSPLQKAALIGQVKPAVASKKPTPPASKQASKPAKGSVKGKKKDGGKEKEKDKGKPAPNPKPGFGAGPAELQAELQARVKRKQSEDTLK